MKLYLLPLALSLQLCALLETSEQELELRLLLIVHPAFQEVTVLSLEQPLLPVNVMLVSSVKQDLLFLDLTPLETLISMPPSQHLEL